MSVAIRQSEKNDTSIADEKVLVLDFGAQYCAAHCPAGAGAECLLRNCAARYFAARVREIAPKGLILSGGPSSVYETGAPHCDPELFQLGIPVLGICYGMQLLCEALGGQVQSAPARVWPRPLHDHFEQRLRRRRVVFWRAGTDRSVDEPRRSGGEGLRRIRAAGAHRDLPNHGGEAQAAADLRLAISSRSNAHAAGEGDSGEFRQACLRLPRHMETGRFCRAGRDGHSRAKLARSA